MFSLNKTSKWMDSLPELNKMLDITRKEGKDIMKEFQTRIKDIENKRKGNIAQKRREKEGILYYGLWQTS